MSDFTNNVLNTDDLPKMEEIDYTSLHKNYKIVILIYRSIFSAFLIGGYFFGMKSGIPYYFQFGLGIATFVLLLLVFGYFGYYKKGYALREKDVSYKRGIIFHSITTIPLNRIQHSELVRGPFDRMLGLGSVKLFTAGGSSSDITIPGLELKQAERVRDYINNKIKQDENA